MTRLYAFLLLVVAGIGLGATFVLPGCDETTINNYYDVDLEPCDWTVEVDTIFIGECSDTSVRLICEHQAELFGVNTLEIYDSALECTYWVQEEIGIVNAEFYGQEIGFREWRYRAFEKSGVHTWQIEHEDDLIPLTVSGIDSIDVYFKLGTTYVRLNHHFYNNCQSSRQISKTY